MSERISDSSGDTELDAAKLVFAGPMGSGKTTAIRSITEREPVATEMPMSDGAIGDKETTTVALDFSSTTLDDGTPLFIYGIPGQERFAYMRSIVLDGAFGVVVVLDGSAEDVAQDCEYWLTEIRSTRPDVAIVVGITHSDVAPTFSLRPIREAIRRIGKPVPTFTFDARERDQTVHLVRALLATLQ
jgi:uncharacterized protein